MKTVTTYEGDLAFPYVCLCAGCAERLASKLGAKQSEPHEGRCTFCDDENCPCTECPGDVEEPETLVDKLAGLIARHDTLAEAEAEHRAIEHCHCAHGVEWERLTADLETIPGYPGDNKVGDWLQLLDGRVYVVVAFAQERHYTGGSEFVTVYLEET